MVTNEPKLLSVLDASIAKGVHRETVRRAIRSGRLPAIRIGRTFFIHQADLQAWQPHYEKSPRARDPHRGVATTTTKLLNHTDQPLSSQSNSLHQRSVVPHNLWAPPTQLLGRGRELELLKAFIQRDGKRLVTLTGPGGCGKTRLAVEAATQLVSAFEDGIWFVDLLPLSDESLILPTIAQTLKLRPSSRRPIQEALTDWLRSRRLLIVLDNFEHLLDGAPDVAALLRECPRVQVLATSRATLHLEAEQVMPLMPLGVPDLSGELSAEEILHSTAVMLFEQRAKSVAPTFRLSDENARATAEICARLDGMPLAIELAAAWVRVLTVDQIASRLDDRFRLLTSGTRAAMPRQQSLRATIDWSYDLLTTPERAALRRLSVFAGGWTVEAAEFIVSGDDVRSNEVLSLLAQLVDKSLVIAETQRVTVRYRLHESIRHYALERLREAGEETKSRERHLAYYIELAEEAEHKLRGVEQLQILDRLEEEHANFRAAIRHALSPERHNDDALRLSGALAWFWYVRSHVVEARDWLSRALDASPERSTSRLKALYGDGYLAHFQRDACAARQRLEEALSLARELGDLWAEAWVIHHLGRLAYFDNDPVTTQLLGEQSLALAEEIEDDWLIAWALHLLGLAAYIAGDYPSSRDYYRRSLSIRRNLGYQEGVGILFHLLGLVALRESDLILSHQLMRDGLISARDVQGPVGMAMPLALAARLAAALDQPTRAVRLAGAIAVIGEDRQSPLIPIFEVLLQEALDAARKMLDGEAFASNWEAGRAMSVEEGIGEALAIELKPPFPLGSPAGTGTDGRFASLTPAEQQVARLLTEGLTTKAIATELYVSVSTIDRHLTHIYSKLGVRNRAEAIALILTQQTE